MLSSGTLGHGIHERGGIPSPSLGPLFSGELKAFTSRSSSSVLMGEATSPIKGSKSGIRPCCYRVRTMPKQGGGNGRTGAWIGDDVDVVQAGIDCDRNIGADGFNRRLKFVCEEKLVFFCD